MNQTTRLLNYLKTGKRCNPLVSWTVLGIYNYSARLTEVKEILRAEGKEIKSGWLHGLNKFNEPYKVKEHWI